MEQSFAVFQPLVLPAPDAIPFTSAERDQMLRMQNLVEDAKQHPNEQVIDRNLAEAMIKRIKRAALDRLLPQLAKNIALATHVQLYSHAGAVSERRSALNRLRQLHAPEEIISHVGVFGEWDRYEVYWNEKGASIEGFVLYAPSGFDAELAQLIGSWSQGFSRTPQTEGEFEAILDAREHWRQAKSAVPTFLLVAIVLLLSPVFAFGENAREWVHLHFSNVEFIGILLVWMGVFPIIFGLFADQLRWRMLKRQFEAKYPGLGEAL